MLKWLGYFALCNVIIAGGRWVIPVVMARTTGPGPGGAPKRNSALSAGCGDRCGALRCSFLDCWKTAG